MYDPVIPEARQAAEMFSSYLDVHGPQIQSAELTWMRIYSHRPWWKFWQKRELIGVAPIMNVSFKPAE